LAIAMNLADWARKKWVMPHTPTRGEIADLLAIVERDLEESIAGRSADWRLAIAYNAALQAATAALAAAGYRAARGDHHRRTLESLTLTIAWDARRVKTLQRFRRVRNRTEYDRAGTVSDAEAHEMRELAIALRDRVAEWLREKHSGLV
jgi:hypothetical protein